MDHGSNMRLQSEQEIAMSADDPKTDPAQFARDSAVPIRPEPKDGGIPAGQHGEIENNANPDDAEADDPGITAEDLTGSNTDTVHNATGDLEGDRDDQPDSDNPNDYGQE
jgi:hypothetical protein